MAGSHPQGDARKPGLQLYMVGVMVSEMRRTLEFYELLGVDVPEYEDQTHVEVEMIGGVVLFFDSDPSRWDPDRGPDREAPGGPYRSLLEFYLGDEAAVRSKYDELVSAGHRGSRVPYSTGFGMCFAMVEDPDGHTILLSGDLSRG